MQTLAARRETTRRPSYIMEENRESKNHRNHTVLPAGCWTAGAAVLETV